MVGPQNPDALIAKDALDTLTEACTWHATDTEKHGGGAAGFSRQREASPQILSSFLLCILHLLVSTDAPASLSDPAAAALLALIACELVRIAMVVCAADGTYAAAAAVRACVCVRERVYIYLCVCVCVCCTLSF